MEKTIRLIKIPGHRNRVCKGLLYACKPCMPFALAGLINELINLLHNGVFLYQAVTYIKDLNISGLALRDFIDECQNMYIVIITIAIVCDRIRARTRAIL